MIGASPFLMFPTFNPWLTALALASIPCLWLARRAVRGAFTERTRLDRWILLLMAMIPVAMWASPLPALSTDAVCRVLLGVALYYALVNVVNGETAWRWTLRAAALGGLAIALIGLVATNWNNNKLPLLNPIYPLLPNLSGALGALAPEADSTPGGFHPNFIGAALAVLLPTVLALGVSVPRRSERALLIVIMALMTGVLLITQSRLSFASLAIALSVTLLRSRPRLRRPAVGVLATGVVLALVLGPGRVLDALIPQVAASGLDSWRARTVLWQGAWQALSDFPFTGIGLSTFYPTATYLYPLDVLLDWQFGHAHETYLQMGLDFGGVGLLAFVGMLLLALRVGWPRRDEPAGPIRKWQIGVWTSLLTYALFGLFDGLPMWTKPGFVVWLLLAWVMIGAERVGRVKPDVAGNEAIDVA